METAERLRKLLESYHTLAKNQKEHINDLENQLYHLKPFRDLVYHIASKRQDSVDDYIMLAKQCIADYESVMKT